MQDVVVAVVQKEKDFVFLQRLNDEWTFPSGKIEDGEEADAAAVREIKEETGLTVDIISNLGVREMGDCRLHYRFCKAVSGELVIGEPDKFKAALLLPPAILLGLAGNKLYPPVIDLLQSSANECRCCLG